MIMVGWDHQLAEYIAFFQEIDSSSDLCHDIAALLDALLIKTLIHDGTYQS